MVGALVLTLAGSVASGDLRPASASATRDVPVTSVEGDTTTESARIGGAVGQDVAPNFSADGAGPETPTTVAKTLWWRWTAPTSGPVSFSTSGSELDTEVAVRPVSAPKTVIASNDDDGDVATSRVTFDAVEGEEYLVEVGTKGGEPGLVTLAWQAPAPALDAAPSAPTALAAGTALTTTTVPLSGNTGEKPQSSCGSRTTPGGPCWPQRAPRPRAPGSGATTRPPGPGRTSCASPTARTCEPTSRPSGTSRTSFSTARRRRSSRSSTSPRRTPTNRGRSAPPRRPSRSRGARPGPSTSTRRGGSGSSPTRAPASRHGTATRPTPRSRLR
ncbi:hypothetical protein NKG05_19730 [Oerskovia sp. M15]